MLVCSRCMYGWSVRSAVDTYMFALVLVSMVRAMYHIESMLSYLWYVWYLSYLWYVSRFRVTVLVHYAVQYFWFHQSCMFHENSRFRADISCARLDSQASTLFEPNLFFAVATGADLFQNSIIFMHAETKTQCDRV